MCVCVFWLLGCLYWIFSMDIFIGLFFLGLLMVGPSRCICYPLIWAGFMSICCMCGTKMEGHWKTMWYPWKFQLKPEDRLLSQARDDEGARWLDRRLEWGRGITDLFAFSWDQTWLRREQQWPDRILAREVGPSQMAQWSHFLPWIGLGWPCSFDALLFHCIFSLLFLLRVLNTFTSILYHCYAHKYILYMTLKCVHNVLLSEKSGFPNWRMTYLTDSDFMSWYHNFGKGTMFWSCFVDDTHIHTYNHTVSLSLSYLLWEFGAKQYFSVIGFMNIYHVNSLFL